MNYAFLVTSMSVTVTNIQCKCHQNLNFDTNIIVAGFQSSLKIKNLNGTWAWQKWMTIKHKLLFHFQTFSKFLWFFSLNEQTVFLRNYSYWFKYYFSDFPNVLKTSLGRFTYELHVISEISHPIDSRTIR